MDEASARRTRSQAKLTGYGVPFNCNLPTIERAGEVKLRSGEAVMRRTMCLIAVSHAAISGSAHTAKAQLERWGLIGSLSPVEQEFLKSQALPERERIQLSWRTEAVVTLMWATGLLDEMPFPDDQYDFEYLWEFWQSVPEGFCNGVEIRPANEILDEADFAYRLHWAARDATLKGGPPPARLAPSVVVERHHAFNWLIAYEDQEWDDVTTDT